MNRFVSSRLAAAVGGGLIVAGTFLVLGVTGRRTTQTIVEQSPVAIQSSAASGSTLTPHAIYVRDAPGVVRVRAHGATGSGFLADRHGDVLTSYDVVAGAGHVMVEFSNYIVRPATVVARDQDDDVAVLRVDLSDVPLVAPLALGDSAVVRVGDPTLAIGNPSGDARTLTSGMVSALQRAIRAPNGVTIDNVIQAESPIEPGSSGGPLLDAAGRVIGIVGGGGAISFAVPIDTAKQMLARVSVSP